MLYDQKPDIVAVVGQKVALPMPARVSTGPCHVAPGGRLKLKGSLKFVETFCKYACTRTGVIKSDFQTSASNSIISEYS